MAELFSKTEIIGAVREYLQGMDFTLRSDYDPIFEPARVPVFASKMEGGEDQEIFVDIITERKIRADAYFKDRVIGRSITTKGLPIPNASSAQFFRHYFPKAQVFWAIPAYAEKDEQFDLFVKNCKKEYIGLLEVAKTGDGNFKVTEIDSYSVPLLKERIDLFKERLGDDLSVEQTEKLEKTIKRWSQEDLSYLVFYPEPKYLAPDISIRDEDCNISRELINKMGELENISYKDVLIDFSKKYRVTTEDDYSIALQVTETLWKKYGIVFPKLHRDFEQILKLDPEYRDHFLHSFQVFLYGAYVIDKMYFGIRGTGFGKKNGDRIEDAWVIAATYHDFNYMIQKFDEWTKRFFISALYLEEEDNNPASLHLSESYVKKGYMFKTKMLTDILSIKVDNIVLGFLYDRILEKKNHGIISGLSLLKYLDKNNKKLSKRVIKAACKAISIHDKNVWEYISGLANDSDSDEIGNRFKDKKVLRKIFFKEDPIPFLLIIADSIQEEGRSRDNLNKAELENLYLKDGKIYTEISFSGEKSSDHFRWKIEEFQLVEKFLSGDNKFDIKIIDVNTKQHHGFSI
ncbi:MAG: hypothetical protein ACFFCW_18925 [Candidatus Hodarchaeota archaeon]